jgi:hypothetical protein
MRNPERVRDTGAMPRRVLLMCDYYADPLWTESGGCMLALDGFPLTDETKSALRAWAETYDALDPLDHEWPSPEYRRDFEAEGRRLWATLQAELGPEYVVGYDSLTEGRIWPAG